MRFFHNLSLPRTMELSKGTMETIEVMFFLFL